MIFQVIIAAIQVMREEPVAAAVSVIYLKGK